MLDSINLIDKIFLINFNKEFPIIIEEIEKKSLHVNKGVN